MKRRTFLKAGLATGATAVAVNAGILAPNTVLAAWNEAAFKTKTIDEGLNAAFGSASASDSADIKLKAPAIAENGAVVPIEVDATAMKGVEGIAIFASKNAVPLACTYKFSAGALGFASVRIKMGETQDVVAVVKAGGKLFKTKSEVKVTIGGCGG
jgi:sulfur-oxidizing protein SoxY